MTPKEIKPNPWLIDEVGQFKKTVMTPKEKAKELVDKYIPFCGMEMTEIQCALIAVEEILKVIDRDSKNLQAYFMLVKQEIEKL